MDEEELPRLPEELVRRAKAIAREEFGSKAHTVRLLLDPKRASRFHFKIFDYKFCFYCLHVVPGSRTQ